MKVAFISNLRAPYRQQQMEVYSGIGNIDISIYYTNKPNENRKWILKKLENIKEYDMSGIKISNIYGYLNTGIYKIVKDNDFILLGGYEQPTMILFSIICSILNKPYGIVVDGVSTEVLDTTLHGAKGKIKKNIVGNAKVIFANGIVGKTYLTKVFGYEEKRIFNQYLSIDTKKIDSLYMKKEIYRKKYREKFEISADETVIIYSGRLIEIKNVEVIVKALEGKQKVVFLILGDGERAGEIKKLAKRLNVKMIITGFIEEQEELFKSYYAGDIIVLPSKVEPWGLVINEGVRSGLFPIISKSCGCVFDFKYSDEFVINEDESLSNIIDSAIKIIKSGKLNVKGIGEEFTHENSKKSFEKMLEYVFEVS